MLKTACYEVESDDGNNESNKAAEVADGHSKKFRKETSKKH